MFCFGISQIRKTLLDRNTQVPITEPAVIGYDDVDERHQDNNEGVRIGIYQDSRLSTGNRHFSEPEFSKSNFASRRKDSQVARRRKRRLRIASF